ncbi:hypothetical protein Tco_0120222, partial [Tanacetum coccineum]
NTTIFLCAAYAKNILMASMRATGFDGSSMIGGCWKVCMFEVLKILEDDSGELVSRGANRLVKVSMSNSVTFSFVSKFVELIGRDEVSLFGKVLGEGASLSIEEEEEDAMAVSSGGRVAAKMRVDTSLGNLKYSSNIS